MAGRVWCHFKDLESTSFSLHQVHGIPISTKATTAGRLIFNSWTVCSSRWWLDTFWWSWRRWFIETHFSLVSGLALGLPLSSDWWPSLGKWQGKFAPVNCPGPLSDLQLWWEYIQINRGKYWCMVFGHGGKYWHMVFGSSSSHPSKVFEVTLILEVALCWVLLFFLCSEDATGCVRKQFSASLWWCFRYCPRQIWLAIWYSHGTKEQWGLEKNSSLFKPQSAKIPTQFHSLKTRWQIMRVWWLNTLVDFHFFATSFAVIIRYHMYLYTPVCPLCIPIRLLTFLLFAYICTIVLVLSVKA